MKVLKLLWFYLAYNEVVSFWASAIATILDLKVEEDGYLFKGLCKSTWRLRLTEILALVHP